VQQCKCTNDIKTLVSKNLYVDTVQMTWLVIRKCRWSPMKSTPVRFASDQYPSFSSRWTPLERKICGNDWSCLHIPTRHTVLWAQVMYLVIFTEQYLLNVVCCFADWLC